MPVKYIVVEIQTNHDGTIGNLVYSFDRQDDAESKYHAVLSAAALSKLPRHACAIMTSDGFVKDCKCYTVEPEVEE